MSVVEDMLALYLDRYRVEAREALAAGDADRAEHLLAQARYVVLQMQLRRAKRDRPEGSDA